MTMFEELKALGVDIDEGLKRLSGNEALYTRLLGKFAKAMETQSVPLDFDANDCTEAIEKAHSLKGSAGNLSLTPIFKTYNEILTLLRTGKPEEAREMLKEFQPVQNEIIQCIEKYME